MPEWYTGILERIFYMKPKELSDSNIQAFISEAASPVLLTFYSPWSKPARTMLPVLEELSVAYDGMVRFGVIDADVARTALNTYGVLNLPTYLLIKGRREADRFIGLLSKEKLTERIEHSLQDMT